MSHIAEVYAKDLGVKIGKPVITEHFFPGLPNRYITIQSSNKMPAANYLYWDIVLNLVKPFLGDIKILQVGGSKDQLVNGVHMSTLGCSYKQMNYIIKKSFLHCGCDSLPGHVASVYDIPTIVLHFNLYPSNSKPLWHKKNSCVSLSPDFSKTKPSFGPSCKRINDIKPEAIAQNILDLLKIDKKIKFKTVRIGSQFHNEIVEIVPNFKGLSEELKDKAINIRGDLHFDLENIINWCQYSIVSLHTSQEIPLEALQIMPNLKQVIFKYEKMHHKKDLNNFFKILKNNKINVGIICDDKEIISDVRLKYFDHNTIESGEGTKKIKASKFLSKKKFISNKQVFPAEFSEKIVDKSDNFVYDDISSKELESLYLYDD